MKRIFFFAFLAFAFPASVQAQWKTLEQGMEYRKSDEPKVHFFRIDPGRFRPDLLMASDFKVAALSADDYRKKSGAVLVLNGGFFDDAFRPMGLRYRKEGTLNPLRDVSWGVFFMGGPEGREPKIVPPKQWPPPAGETVTMALQVGPRLVIDGKIPKFKEGPPSRRSAVGIASDGWIVIALSETPLLLKEWATLLKEDCPQALNLDGGGSSQFSFLNANLSSKVDGLTNVPDVLAIFRK